LPNDLERTMRNVYDNKFIDFLKSAETRIAYQLSLRYFLDANPTLGALVKRLKGDEIVFLDTAEEGNPMHLLLVGNCIPHINVQIENFSTITLSPHQTLIISSNLTVEEEHKSKIVTFVESGGVILSFNKSITVIASTFPDSFKFKNGESTLDKKVDVVVNETEDKHLFLGLQNASQRKKSIRFAGVRKFRENPENPNVTILVKENSTDNYNGFPLAAKLKHGSGFVFHFVHVGSDELLELRSRERAEFYCKQVEEGPNIHEATKMAWKSALLCSQWGSFYLAISLLLFFDIVFGIINKYNRS